MVFSIPQIVIIALVSALVVTVVFEILATRARRAQARAAQRRQKEFERHWMRLFEALAPTVAGHITAAGAYLSTEQPLHYPDNSRSADEDFELLLKAVRNVIRSRIGRATTDGQKHLVREAIANFYKLTLRSTVIAFEKREVRLAAVVEEELPGLVSSTMRWYVPRLS